MNTQTKTAFKTLYNIFGKPDWATSNQRKSVEDEWENALAPYSEEQVRNACYRYSKYNKSGKFPHLACIEAELVDVEANENVSTDRKLVANRMYQYCVEHAKECNPIPDKISIQRSIWKNYKVAVDGYNPEADKDWWK